MSTLKIGIRREDKNPWEKRVPLIPSHIGSLIREQGIEFVVQPSLNHRAFDDHEYIKEGAVIDEDLSSCDVIFGVKEIPIPKLIPGKVHIFFAHVIKGQAYNMPMLRSILENRCSLIDYEKIEDEQNRRLVFFGRHAGLAGMVEALHAFGKRMKILGVDNPFTGIRQPYLYNSLKDIRKSMFQLGEEIMNQGLPDSLTPVVFGFTGYGNVSKGAQEIFDHLPHIQIQPSDLLEGISNFKGLKKALIKVVFQEKDMVKPNNARFSFDLQDYYKNPEKYHGCFEDYIPSLSALVNCIYWAPQYPRLISKEYLQKSYTIDSNPKLKVVGDISCDIDGSIEATVKSTYVDNPSYVYDPIENKVKDGLDGRGLAIMAIDNLPCEISKDASNDFSAVLRNFVPELAKADVTVSFDSVKLPPELKRAVIVYRGELTERYRSIQKFLDLQS